MIKISGTKKGNVFVLGVSERLDSVTAPDLENKINQLIDSGETNLLIDFSNLEYISSAGLRVLLAAAKRLKEKNGKLLICSIGGMVKEVFKLSGFNEILSVYVNEDEALKNI